MPITTLTGKNTFEISRTLAEIKSTFAAEFGADNIISLDGENCSYDDVAGAVFAQGLFSRKSLVILIGVEGNKYLQEKLADSLDAIPDEAHLVISDPKLDKRTTFYKKLKASSNLQSFAEPDEYGLAKWVVDEFKLMNGEIGRAEANMLVGRVGADQWALKNELDKLVNHPQPVAAEIIEEVVDKSFRETIFSLLDVAFAKKPAATIEMYRELIANRVDPYYILSMIAWQTHTLLLVAHAGRRSADEIAKEAKLSPYVVRKCRSALAKTTKSEVNKLAAAFVDVDYTSKTSSATNVEALVEQLLVQIAS